MRWILFGLLFCIASCGSNAEYLIRDARIREPVPGQTKSVGYFTLANQTDENLVLVGVSIAGVGAVEMHETTERDGVMRMRKLKEVSIPAASEVAFVPGGKHLMLFRISELNAPVDVEFTFADGRVLTQPFELVPFTSTN